MELNMNSVLCCSQMVTIWQLHGQNLRCMVMRNFLKAVLSNKKCISATVRAEKVISCMYTLRCMEPNIWMFSRSIKVYWNFLTLYMKIQRKEGSFSAILQYLWAKIFFYSASMQFVKIAKRYQICKEVCYYTGEKNYNIRHLFLHIWEKHLRVGVETYTTPDAGVFWNIQQISYSNQTFEHAYIVKCMELYSATCKQYSLGTDTLIQNFELARLLYGDVRKQRGKRIPKTHNNHFYSVSVGYSVPVFNSDLCILGGFRKFEKVQLPWN